MTIAVGILCADGVVIGSDLQYSTGSMKTVGKKIFTLVRGEQRVLIALSGGIDPARIAIQEIDKTLPAKFDFETLERIVTEALIQVHAAHVDSAPSEYHDALRFELLLGAQAEGTCRLYRTNRTMIVEERSSACAGMGFYLGAHTLEMLLPEARTAEVGLQVAVYVIGAAREYVETVGKGTDVHTLWVDGSYRALHKNQHEAIFAGFEKLMHSLRTSIACCDRGMVSSTDVPMFTGSVTANVWALREAQSSRYRLEEMRRFRQVPIGNGEILSLELPETNPTAPQDPPPTTDDPSTPPPSQE